eukprot:SAG11_NODE_1259_length_5357_cov_34.538227_4_plen_206_part_00
MRCAVHGGCVLASPPSSRLCTLRGAGGACSSAAGNLRLELVSVPSPTNPRTGAGSPTRCAVRRAGRCAPSVLRCAACACGTNAGRRATASQMCRTTCSRPLRTAARRSTSAHDRPFARLGMPSAYFRATSCVLRVYHSCHQNMPTAKTRGHETTSSQRTSPKEPSQRAASVTLPCTTAADSRHTRWWARSQAAAKICCLASAREV